MSEDTYIPEDEADTYTSWLNQLANDIGCTYKQNGVYMDLTYLHYSVIK